MSKFFLLSHASILSLAKPILRCWCKDLYNIIEPLALDFLLLSLQAHAEYVLCKSFIDYIRDLKSSEAVKSALSKMCSLLCVYYLTENGGDLLQVKLRISNAPISVIML